MQTQKLRSLKDDALFKRTERGVTFSLQRKEGVFGFATSQSSKRTYKIRLKKLVIALSLLLFCFVGFSQKVKADTVYQPVYIQSYERTDTLAVETILYGEEGKPVIIAKKGYIVLKGQAFINNKKWQWLKDPIPFMALDRNKKPIKNWIVYY